MTNECPSGRTIIPTAGRLFQRPNDYSGGRILPRIVTPAHPDRKGMFYNDGGNEAMATTEHIPASLMIPYLYKNHSLFTDNFYISPTLAEFFLNNGTELYGTVRSNHKHFWKDIIDVSLEKGEAPFYRSTNNIKIIVSKYRAAKEKSGINLKIVHVTTSISEKISDIDYRRFIGERRSIIILLLLLLLL